MEEARQIMKKGLYIQNINSDGSFEFVPMQDKLQGFKNSFINSTFINQKTTEGIAHSLANNYLLSKDFSQLHKPKTKQLTLEQYKNEIEKHKLYRKNSSLQINSELNQWHDQLLQTELNVKDWKAIVGIYNYIYKQIFG